MQNDSLPATERDVIGRECDCPRLLDAMRRLIDRGEAPYEDLVQRRSGLPAGEFRRAVEDLLASRTLMRCSAPSGTLLYLTLRGATAGS